MERVNISALLFSLEGLNEDERRKCWLQTYRDVAASCRSITSTRGDNGEQAADDVHVSPQRHPHHRRHVTAWRYLARNGEFGAGARLCASTRQLPPLILLSRRSKGAALVDSTSDKSDGVSELTRVLWEITKVGREIKISTYISLCHFFFFYHGLKKRFQRYWDIGTGK